MACGMMILAAAMLLLSWHPENPVGQAGGTDRPDLTAAMP